MAEKRRGGIPDYSINTFFLTRNELEKYFSKVSAMLEKAKDEEREYDPTSEDFALEDYD